MTLRTAWAVLAIAGATVTGCKGDAIPAPDPKGKDIVAGAVIAAVTSAEPTPGIRTYKVLHVDDYPEPIGYNYHLAAYDPKAATFEQAREIRRRGKMTVVLGHLEVRAVDFLKRDHRVIAKEALTEAELAPYEKARTSR